MTLEGWCYETIVLTPFMKKKREKPTSPRHTTPHRQAGTLQKVTLLRARQCEVCIICQGSGAIPVTQSECLLSKCNTSWMVDISPIRGTAISTVTLAASEWLLQLCIHLKKTCIPNTWIQAENKTEFTGLAGKCSQWGPDWITWDMVLSSDGEMYPCRIELLPRSLRGLGTVSTQLENMQ